MNVAKGSLPLIVFATTCKGRLQHIERTLPQNLEDNQTYPNAKFVVLDYNSQDSLVRYLEEKHSRELSCGRVVLYRYTEPAPFRMAHAKNLAHRAGILEGADILVNMDADNFTGPDFAWYIAEKFSNASEEIFLWARGNKHRHGADRIPKGCGGRIVVSSSAFMKIGGYDEKFDTWGPDDKDFHFRLSRAGLKAEEIERVYLEAILHNDRMRFKDYRHVQPVSYEQMSDQFGTIDDSDTTIANFGKFGAGILYRNWESTPIPMEPVPTRIFGIGMHKTATTSLNAALKIMGYDSAHWKSVAWAKAIWQEMKLTGRSKTLERHYALSDLPITTLYDKLDAAYPGSKFILTTRNEKDWIESVRNHWGRENTFRGTWRKEDSFPDRLHHAIYGQSHFDAEVMVNRYRKHNGDVKEYFSARPGDLLLMDMDTHSGWYPLCGFLKQPIPIVPYPRKFRTGSKEWAGDYQI